MSKEQSRKWYAFVPNLFTSGNMVCGILGVYFALNNRIGLAVWLMFFSAFFDFFDGFIARLLKVTSEMGKQLDSLSDLISFGLLPGALVFITMMNSMSGSINNGNPAFMQWVYMLTPIFIPVFSAFRLARFNIDKRQVNEFIGLPTPANALFFAALCLSMSTGNVNFIQKFGHPLVLAILTIIFSFLLVSNLRLFSLKFKTFSLKENMIRYIFLAGSAILIILFSISGLALVIVFYIMLSLLKNLFKK
ncbi:MAG: CDP-diacylglycerol--serine O-phosphatidyltransferase [Prolixibacteraceae bacterium]|nr:CDP-diacylglycerol--serine O-phosphatidyltransferase [Prolixibacteraceae bacterium]